MSTCNEGEAGGDETELLNHGGQEDHGCGELGERAQWMDERCARLVCEIQRVNGNCKALEARNKELEVENQELKERVAWLENKQKASSGKNAESNILKFVDLTEEEEGEDAVFQLMIENKALECEKQKAERDAELWKGKFEELVLWVSKRDERGIEELVNYLDSPGLSLRKEIIDLKNKLCGVFESNLCRQVRKQLVFEAEDDRSMKLTPSTPGVAKHFLTTSRAIDIDDSDDDVEIDTANLSSPVLLQNQRNWKESDSAKDVSSLLTPKRKRVSRVVTSDTDSDDDDLPISRLKKPNNSVISSGMESSRVISSAIEVDEDDESEFEDIGLGSEEESLDGFIVSDGDETSSSSKSEDISNNELEDISHNESEDEISDSETDFEKVISKIRRRRDCKPSEWKFEGDMLAAFGKDPELCMKAVCALYRQQTADERVSKETFYNNGRGFSKFDALRGCKLGEFLTEGDPEGDLKKTVDELQEHDPKAVELCRTLATHYSKQLFDIYQKEDPFFLPR